MSNLCLGEDDLKFWSEGKTVIGVDDCGRGCIAGSMFFAFVSFNINNFLIKDLGLNDSKKLTNNKRLDLDDKIKQISKFKIVEVSIDEINYGENLNLLFAKHFTKNMICFSSEEKLYKNNAIILLDGAELKDLKWWGAQGEIKLACKPKYDGLSWHVAAASIIAKNAQVKSMERLDELYPEYGFKDHHGYGTKKHYEAIKKYGVCPAHRVNWIK